MKVRSFWAVAYAKNNIRRLNGFSIRRSVRGRRKKVNNIVNLSIRHKGKRSKKYGYLV